MAFELTYIACLLSQSNTAAKYCFAFVTVIFRMVAAPYSVRCTSSYHVCNFVVLHNYCFDSHKHKSERHHIW